MLLARPCRIFTLVVLRALQCVVRFVQRLLVRVVAFMSGVVANACLT